MYYLFGAGYHRGFFCDDESLMHPFHESTVTHEVLYTVGFGLPLVTIVITELIRWKRQMDNGGDIKLFGSDIPFWVQQVYKYYGIFLFGASCSQLTTDIAKYSIGRFRPHFISVCQPIIMPSNTTCSDPENQGRYIEEFTCGNPDSTARRLKEMRLSFPSGHSSFSMYTMVFAALYLHCRMTLRGSKLLKHVLQFTFIMLAWFTALSRISDYKHHCKFNICKLENSLYDSFYFSSIFTLYTGSDVLAGSTQGLVVCLLIVFGVTDLFKNRWGDKKSDLPITQRELNSINRND